MPLQTPITAYLNDAFCATGNDAFSTSEVADLSLAAADDAGATEVAFLLDEQSYGTNSVLGEQMNHAT